MRSAKAQAAIDKLLKESGTTTSGSTTPKTGNSVSGNASAQAAINKLLGNSTPATPNLNAMAGDSRYAAPTPTPAANLGQNAGVNGVELPKFFTPQYTSSGETNAMAGDSRYAPKGMQATTTPFDSISKLTDLDSRLPRLFNQENELSKSDENNLPARYFSKAEIDSRSNELSEYYKKLDAVRKELSADNLWNPDMETWYKANRGNLDILSQNNENRRAFYSQYSDAHAFARDRDRNARIIAAQKTRDTTIENYKRRANGADINNDIEAAQKELEDAQAALKVAKKTPFALTTDLSTLGDNLDTMVQNDSRLAPVGTNVFAQRSSQLPQETDLNNVEDLDALLQSSKPNPANAFLPRPQTDEKTQTPEDARTQRISEAQAAVKKAQERLNELKSIKYQIDFDFNNEKLKAESANLSLDEIDAKVAKSQQAADEALETEKGSGWEGLAGRLVQGGISTEEDTAYTAEVSAKAQQMIDNSAAKAQATQDARAELEHWKAIREYKLAELAHADTDFLETANTAVAKPMQKEEFNALLDDYYFGAEIDKTTRLKTGNISEEEFIASLGNLVEFYKEHSDWFKGSKRDPGEIGIALSQMTDDENNLYNYYEKKYGLETANEYLDSIKDLLLMRKAETEVTGNPGVWDITKSAVTAGGNQWVSGMNTAMAQYLKLGNGETNTTLANLEAQVVKQKLTDDTSSVGKIKNTWFDVVSNVTNMAPSLVLSTMLGMIGSGLFAGELTNLGAAAATGAFDMGLVSTKKFYDAFTKASKLAGSTMLGMSAAGNGYTEALDMGLSPAQARTYGLLTGASEAALETILGGLTEFRIVTPDGISALLTKKIDSMVGKPLLRTLGHLALSTASEVNEEVLQDLLSPAFNSIITGADYDAPTIEELAYTALVTTLTTGLLEGKNAIREGYTQGTDWNMFFNSYMQAKDMNPDLVGPNYLRMLDYCAEAVSYGEDSEFRKQMQPYLDAMQSAIQTSDPTGFMTAVAQISPDAMLAINKARAEGYEEYIAAPAREKNTARFNEAQLNRLVTDKTEIKKLFPDASKFDRGRIVAAVSDIMQGKQISPEAKALLTTPETAAVVAELLSGTTYGVELYEDRVQVDENGKVAREERTYKPIVEAVLKTDATKLAEAYDTIATRISEDRASVEKYHAGQSVPVAETEATTEAPAAFDLDRHDILWKLNGAGIEFSQINDITTTIYKLFTGERLTATDIRILSDGVSNSKTDSTVRGIISDILNANGKASAKLAQNLMRGAETYAELTDMYNKLSDEIALETNPTASAEKTKPVVDRDGTNIIDPNGDYEKLSDRDKMEILAYKYLAENTDGVKITDVIIDASLSPVENGRRVTGTTTIRVNPASYGNTRAVGNTRVFQARRLGEAVGHEMFHVKLDAIGSRDAATGKASEARLNAITNVLNNARAVEGDNAVDSWLSSTYTTVRSGHETIWRAQHDIDSAAELTEDQQAAFDKYVAPYLTRDSIEEEVACDYIGLLFANKATLHTVTQQDTGLVYKILSSLYKYRVYNKNNQVLRDIQILDDTAAMLWGSVKVEEARSDLAAAATDADTVVNKNVLKKHMSQSWSDQVNDLLTMFDNPAEARRPINEYFVPCMVNGNEGLVSRGLGKGAILAKYSALKEALDTGVISESDLRNLEMILKNGKDLYSTADAAHPGDVRIKFTNSEGKAVYVAIRPASKNGLKSSVLKSYNTIVEFTSAETQSEIERTQTAAAKPAPVVQEPKAKPKVKTEPSETDTASKESKTETDTPVDWRYAGAEQQSEPSPEATRTDVEIQKTDAFGRQISDAVMDAIEYSSFYDEDGHPMVFVEGPGNTLVPSSNHTNTNGLEFCIAANNPKTIDFRGQEIDNYAGPYEEYGDTLESIADAIDAEGFYDSVIFTNIVDSENNIYEQLVWTFGDEQRIPLSFTASYTNQITADNGATELDLDATQYSNSTENSPQPKAKYYTYNDDSNPFTLQTKDGVKRNFTVQELRDPFWRKAGFSEKQIAEVHNVLSDLNAVLDTANETYTNLYLSQFQNAQVLLDRNGNVLMSCKVQNAEYPVNFDFTKECKKRQNLQRVIDALVREQGRVTEEGTTVVDLSPENIAKINKILAAENLETNCLGCFVEAARAQMQSKIENILMADWNAEVEKYNPNAEYFNFAGDESLARTPLDVMPEELSDTINDELKKVQSSDKPNEWMASLLENVPELRKKLQLSDFLTERGRTRMHQEFPEIDSYAKKRLGVGSFKMIEQFVPYNGELETLSGLLTPNKAHTGFVVDEAALARTLRKLYVNAGARSQSFSDFVITHVYDVMQKSLSLTALGATAHTYTKEISRAVLFGMTGEKHNLSVLLEVDSNGDPWSAGLTKSGNFFVGDYEHFKLDEGVEGKAHYLQSIGWNDAVTLQNTEGYTRDCGIIIVPLSYKAYLKALNDPECRQIIGYHSSGMPFEVQRTTGYIHAADYEAVQNTLEVKGFQFVNYKTPDDVPCYATPPASLLLKYAKGEIKEGRRKATAYRDFAVDGFEQSDAIKADLKANYESKITEKSSQTEKAAAAKEALTEFLEVMQKYNLRPKTSKAKVDTGKRKDGKIVWKAQTGHGDFDLYGDVEKTQDPYASTDNYIEFCVSRGWLPQFYEFALNDNYFKQVFDFNVFDRRSYTEIDAVDEKTGEHIKKGRYLDFPNPNNPSEMIKAYAPLNPVHTITKNEDGSITRNLPEDFNGKVLEFARQYSEDQVAPREKALPEIISKLKDNLYKDEDGNPLDIVKTAQYSINGKVVTGSFFSGGGTFEYALKHDIVSAFGVEWDYRPSGLFRANNGDSVHVADVRNFIKQIKNYDGKLEYFHASPSCQRASRANNKGGETELDVTTAQATIEAIRATTPQIVTIENVPEYIKFDSYKNIIKTLEDLGYTYDTVIINSKGYGSNTARERMIIRAVKNGTLPALPGETYVNEDGITIAGRNGEVTGDWYSPFAEEIEALEDAKSREDHGINGIPDYVIRRLEEQYPNAKLNIWWNANTGRVEGLTKPLLLVGGVKSGELYFVDAGKPAPTLTTKIGDMRIILPDGTVKAVSPELAAKWQGIEGYSRTDPITGKQFGKTTTFKVIGNGMAGETTRLIVQDLFNSQKEAGYIVDTDNADATTQDLTETQYKTAVDLLKDTKQSYEDALANGADPEVIDQLKHQVEEGEAMINRMLNRSGTGETKQQEKVSNTNNKLFPDDGIQYSLRTAPPPKVDYSDEIKRLPGYERHRINWDNPSIENAYNIQGISDRYERDKNSYEFGVSGIIDAETGLPYIPEQNQYSFTPNHSSAMQDIIDDVTSRPDSHATEISKFKTDTLDNGSIFSDAEKVDPKYIDDAFAYDRETEKASMLQAQAALNADFNGEVTRLENQSNWGGGVDTDIAMGILDRIDNIDDKIAWAEQIAERVREQGRGIQALAKYSHTPDGVILRAVRALRQSNLSQAEKLAVLRDVTGFAQQLKAMKGTSTGLIDLIKDQALMRNTPVSNRTLQNLQKQDVTFLYDAALNQLDQIAKDYIPATVGKKISTYQTMAHLLNPRTFLRNLTSNEAFDTMDIIANNIAKPMDAFLSLFTGQQTVGWEWGALSKEGRAGRRAGRQRTQVEVALDISPEEGKDKYGTARRTNKMVGGWGARAMSSLEKVMGYELNVPDEAAKGLIMADVINSLDPMVKAGTISEDQAVQLAVEQALYRTFQDETWVGNRLRDIKKALNTVGVGSSEATRRAVNGGNLTNPSGKTPDVIKDFGLGDLVCKYTQVPGALITRSVEYGPTGLAKCIVNLYRMAEAQKNFKAKAATAGISETDAAYNNTLNFDRFHAQRNAALQMGRFVTGSGLLALFTAMAKAGLLRRNDEDEDPDLLALETAAGLSGTQINISALERWADGTNDSVLPQAGDKLASVDFLEPLNSLLALGTVLAKRNEEVSAYDLAIDSFQTLYADIAELSVFQTIGTVKDTITYHDEESKVPVGLEVAIELGKSSVTGFVPSLIRQTATAADPFYRDLYTGENDIENLGDQVQSTLPFFRQNLPTKLDNFGNVKTYEADPFLRALNASVMPGSINTYRPNQNLDELRDVYNATGEDAIVPSRNGAYSVKDGNGVRYELTPDERRQYLTTRGNISDTLMRELMQSDIYREADETKRAEMLKTLNSYAEHKAKEEFLGAKGADYSSRKYESLDKYMQTEGLSFADAYDLTANTETSTFTTVDKNSVVSKLSEMYRAGTLDKQQFLDSYYTEMRLREDEDDSAYNKLVGAVDIGVEPDAHFVHATALTGFEATKDENGESISGSKVAQQMTYLAEQCDAGKLNSEQAYYYYGTLQDSYPEHAEEAKAAGIDGVTYAHILGEAYTTKVELGSGKQDNLCPIIYDYYRQGAITVDQADTLYHILFPTAKSAYKQAWHKR